MYQIYEQKETHAAVPNNIRLLPLWVMNFVLHFFKEKLSLEFNCPVQNHVAVSFMAHISIKKSLKTGVLSDTQHG